VAGRAGAEAPEVPHLGEREVVAGAHRPAESRLERAGAVGNETRLGKLLESAKWGT
jgi:hypothetical protein